MDEKIFQTVFDKISVFLPDGWTKMAFYAEYSEGSFSMKFYYKMRTSDYVSCFDIPDVSDTELFHLFIDIDKELSVSRKELGDKVWSVFTMIVEDNGFMKTYFDYEDHSHEMIGYERKWADKYLR